MSSGLRWFLVVAWLVALVIIGYTIDRMLNKRNEDRKRQRKSDAEAAVYIETQKKLADAKAAKYNLDARQAVLDAQTRADLAVLEAEGTARRRAAEREAQLEQKRRWVEASEEEVRQQYATPDGSPPMEPYLSDSEIEDIARRAEVRIGSLPPAQQQQARADWRDSICDAHGENVAAEAESIAFGPDADQ